MGGNQDKTGTISKNTLFFILKEEFELTIDMEVSLSLYISFRNFSNLYKVKMKTLILMNFVNYWMKDLENQERVLPESVHLPPFVLFQDVCHFIIIYETTSI
jgi:hypothetical protein